MSMKISMVIPCYNSEKTIEHVVNEIMDIFKQLSYEYEIVLINDCSKDDTWKKIQELCESHKHIIGIDFAKNAGQHAAVMAGFHKVSGDIVMSCDDDGQTPSENIPLLIEKLLNENYDVVCAKYVEFEKKRVTRRIGTKLNSWMANWLIERPAGVETCLFMAAKRYVIDEICNYVNPYPYIGGLLLRTTHNIGNVEMMQHARRAGNSGYSLRKLIRLWLNGFTAFSIKPLRVSSILGMSMAALGFIYGIIIIIRKFLTPSIQTGWSSTMIILLIAFGIILIVLGIIGEYLGRIYMCINNTPQYVVREYISSSNGDDGK